MNNDDFIKALEKAKEEKFLSIYNFQLDENSWKKILEIEDLETIYLYNLFIDIPNELNQLKTTTIIALTNCIIENGNIFFSKFPELKILFVDKCKLADRILTGINCLSKLYALMLSNIELDCLPNSVIELPNLKMLEIDNINLKNYDNFNKLKNTFSIKIKNNNMNSIPSEVYGLKKLTDLNFSDNILQIIPQELFENLNLSVLDLKNNQIKELPSDLADLNKLNELHLAGNPLNAKKFGYLLPNKNNNFFKTFFEFLSNANSVFTFPYGDINSSKNFIIFSIHNTTILLETDKIKSSLNFNYTELNKNLISDDLVILISIFGEDGEQKKSLFLLRETIETWLKDQEYKLGTEIPDNPKIASRFFYYPISNMDKNETIIYYDKLIKYKNAGENLFFDDNNGMKIPVADLLNYIGEKNIPADIKWNGTDYLTNLKITDFKLFHEINIDLSKNINIILGHNGLGKTSLLQAITLGLLPIDNYDKSNNFKKFIKFESSKSEVLLNWGIEEFRKTYIFHNELNEEKYVNFPQKVLLAYGVNLNTDIILDHTGIINNLIAGNAESYSTKSIFCDYSTDFFDPLVILEQLDREEKYKKNIKTCSIVKLIKDTINSYLKLIEASERIELQGENAYYYFKDLNGNKLRLQNLSEGFKDHILLLADILIRIIAARNTIFQDKGKSVNSKLFKETCGVIIIDEFDRHIHPVWQRKLLTKLKSDFPNIQFVLTTHNAFSVQSAVGANAIQLVVEKGNIVAKNSTIESKNILSIISEYFTKDFFDDKSQELLDKFNRSLEKIYSGDFAIVYSDNFKSLVEQINNRSEELQSLIAGQLLQLNSTLKKHKQKEFEL